MGNKIDIGGSVSAEKGQVNIGNTTKRNTTVKISIGAVVITIAIAFIFVFNTNLSAETIVGTWELEGHTYFEFFKDGSYKSVSDAGTYKTSESGVLTLYNLYDYPTMQMGYRLEDKGKTLFLKIGEYAPELELKRVS